MAPDADATAGTPKGWHDLEAVLAEEPVARLMATYLDGHRTARACRSRPAPPGAVAERRSRLGSPPALRTQPGSPRYRPRPGSCRPGWPAANRDTTPPGWRRWQSVAPALRRAAAAAPLRAG